MSHQEGLPLALTPQETAAAARAAAEAAIAAGGAAGAATDVPPTHDSESPAVPDKTAESIASEPVPATAAPSSTAAEETASRDAQQNLSPPEEAKPDVPVDATMTATSAPMPDPSIPNQMAQVARTAALSAGATMSSVSPGPTTSIQPQPSQAPAATQVPNLPSVVSPIQKKASNLTPFICDVVGCGKAFGKKFNLKAHRRVHTGDEPFVCSFPTCGKRFKWKSSLSFHEGLHLNAPEDPHPQAAAAELAAAAVAVSASPPNPTALDPNTNKKPGKV